MLAAMRVSVVGTVPCSIWSCFWLRVISRGGFRCVVYGLLTAVSRKCVDSFVYKNYLTGTDMFSLCRRVKCGSCYDTGRVMKIKKKHGRPPHLFI